MPYSKDKAKMTGDTHLPDVESDMFEEGSADAAGTDEAASDRGQATERVDQTRPSRGKASAVKARKAKASGEGSGRG